MEKTKRWITSSPADMMGPSACEAVNTCSNGSILCQLVNSRNTMTDKSITGEVCRISAKYRPVCQDLVGTERPTSPLHPPSHRNKEMKIRSLYHLEISLAKFPPRVSADGTIVRLMVCGVGSLPCMVHSPGVRRGIINWSLSLYCLWQ